MSSCRSAERDLGSVHASIRIGISRRADGDFGLAGTVVAIAAQVTVRVAKVFQDFELPTSLGGSEANDGLKFFVLGLFSSGEFAEINVQLIEGFVAIGDVNRASAKWRDVVDHG